MEVKKKEKKKLNNTANPVISTGVFTAPVSGVYYFSIFYHVGSGLAGRLLLHKNDDLVAITHDHKDSADNGGNARSLQLQAGDVVYVKLAAESHVWATDFHTTFNGFLISRM